MIKSLQLNSFALPAVCRATCASAVPVISCCVGTGIRCSCCVGGHEKLSSGDAAVAEVKIALETIESAGAGVDDLPILKDKRCCTSLLYFQF